MTTFDEAKIILNNATRWELRDHAFGDMEFGWTDANENHIGSGYSNNNRCHVEIYGADGFPSPRWTGDEARELKKCGKVGVIERNDETGPEEYVEGQIMPGLTAESVFKEITTP